MKRIFFLLALALIVGTSFAQGMPHHRDDHRPHHHSIRDYTLDEEHFEIAVRHLSFRSNQDKMYKYMGRP